MIKTTCVGHLNNFINKSNVFSVYTSEYNLATITLNRALNKNKRKCMSKVSIYISTFHLKLNPMTL